MADELGNLSVVNGMLRGEYYTIVEAATEAGKLGIRITPGALNHRVWSGQQKATKVMTGKGPRAYRYYIHKDDLESIRGMRRKYVKRPDVAARNKARVGTSYGPQGNSGPEASPKVTGTPKLISGGKGPLAQLRAALQLVDLGLATVESFNVTLSFTSGTK